MLSLSDSSSAAVPGGEALMKSVVHQSGKGSSAKSNEGITWGKSSHATGVAGPETAVNGQDTAGQTARTVLVGDGEGFSIDRRTEACTI